jgi:signal transduction histidine kinase
LSKFEPWDWIVGTGIYLDDVEEELASLNNKMIFILLAITFIIALIIFLLLIKALISKIRDDVRKINLRESRG